MFTWSRGLVWIKDLTASHLLDLGLPSALTVGQLTFLNLNSNRSANSSPCAAVTLYGTTVPCYITHGCGHKHRPQPTTPSCNSIPQRPEQQWFFSFQVRGYSLIANHVQCILKKNIFRNMLQFFLFFLHSYFCHRSEPISEHCENTFDPNGLAVANWFENSTVQHPAVSSIILDLRKKMFHRIIQTHCHLTEKMTISGKCSRLTKDKMI